ncbi:hypothetical protein MP228_009065 [Amoeboaphelidium protococcarum]|nr:hypothetical protein MP228_009065 [Amoeboaphelidium protococcarum]
MDLESLSSFSEDTNIPGDDVIIMEDVQVDNGYEQLIEPGFAESVNLEKLQMLVQWMSGVPYNVSSNMLLEESIVENTIHPDDIYLQFINTELLKVIDIVLNNERVPVRIAKKFMFSLCRLYVFYLSYADALVDFYELVRNVIGDNNSYSLFQRRSDLHDELTAFYMQEVNLMQEVMHVMEVGCVSPESLFVILDPYITVMNGYKDVDSDLLQLFRCLSSADQFLKGSRQSIVALVKVFLGTDIAQNRQFNVLLFSLGYDLFIKVQQLEKKLLGLSIISESVQTLLKLQQQSSDGVSMDEQLHFNVDFQDLLSQLLSRQEFISRSLPIVRWMISNELFDRGCIEKVINVLSSPQQHDSLRQVVTDLVVDIIQEFGAAGNQFMLQSIRDYVFAIDSTTLEKRIFSVYATLIQCFNAMQMDEDVRICLQKLWWFCCGMKQQSDSAVSQVASPNSHYPSQLQSQNLWAGAFEILSKVCSRNTDYARFEQYCLDLAWNSFIEDPSHLYFCVVLFQCLLDSDSQLVRPLIDRGLISKLEDSFIGYHMQVRSRVKDMIDSSPNPQSYANFNWLDSVLVGHVQVGSVVESVLRFYLFLKVNLQQSNLDIEVVSKPYVEKLWSEFVVNGVCEQEQVMVIQGMCGILDSQLVSLVLSQLLPQLKYHDLTLNLYHSIENMFLMLNARNSSVTDDTEQNSDQSRRKIKVQNFNNIVQLDTLWALYWGIGDNHVVSACLNTLVQIYQGNKDTASLFVTNCMNRVGPEIEDSRHLGRALFALQQFVQQELDNRKSNLPQKRGISNVNGESTGWKSPLISTPSLTNGWSLQREGNTRESSMQLITLYIQLFGSGPGDRRKIQLGSQDTVSRLRFLISQEFGMQPEEVRILAVGKSLDNDEQTLGDCHIVDQMVIQVIKRMQTAISVQKSDVKQLDQSMYSLSDLFDGDAFQRLFSLLDSSDNEVQSLAWQLIKMLPPSSSHQKAVRNALSDPSEFLQLFQTSSGYGLLYDLQILYDDLRKQDNVSVIAPLLKQHGDQILETLIVQITLILQTLLSAPQDSVRLGQIDVLLNIVDIICRKVDIAPKMTKSQVDTFIQFSVKSMQDWQSCPLDLSYGLMIVVLKDQSALVDSLDSLPKYLASLLVLMVGSEYGGSTLLGLDYSRHNDIRGFNKKCFDHIEEQLSHFDKNFQVQLVFKMVKQLSLLHNYCYDCKLYFELMKDLLKSIDSAISGSEDAVNLLTLLCVQLFARSVSKEYYDQNTSLVDHFTVGLVEGIQLVFQLQQHEDSQFIPDFHQRFNLIKLMFDYLFDIPTLLNRGKFGPPVAKSMILRQSCYDLIRVVSQQSWDQFVQVVKLVQEQQEIVYCGKGLFEYSPGDGSKSVTGRVGLKNLGATCYMNSLLQQFYMIQPFRNQLLSIRKYEESKDEDFIFQLQNLFVHLMESERRAYNTLSFTKTCRDIEGNKMNVYQQMDVDEFYNVFLDKVEGIVKDTDQQDIVKTVFGGQLLQQIKSRDCEHVSERREAYYSIQCEVKNQQSLVDSLHNFIKEEVLDGDNKYFCGQCQTHVSATKRICVQDLPPVLVFSLKRFDFDFETMRRLKIYDRFEFPSMINMKEYTADFINQDGALGSEDMVSDAPSNVISPASTASVGSDGIWYKLRGVLVHTGTADSGHYYSYIREDQRIAGASQSQNQSENEKWLLFNDSLVEPFDVNNIPEECFGGHVNNSDRMKNYSAYMLFYDRVEDGGNPSMHVEMEKSQSQSKAPQELVQSVWEENFQHYKDRNYYDTNYYSLIEYIIQQMLDGGKFKDTADPNINVNSELFKVGQIAFRYLVNVLVHSKDFYKCKQIARSIMSLVEKNADLSRWILQQFIVQNDMFVDMTLQCYLVDVRSCITQLILCSIKTIRSGALESRIRNNVLEEVGGDTEDCYGFSLLSLGSPAQVKVSRSVTDDRQEAINVGPLMFRFMEQVHDLMVDSRIRKHWKYFNEFWELLVSIAQLGREESMYMLHRGFHSIALELCDDPYGTAGGGLKMKDKVDDVNLQHVQLLMCILVKFALGDEQAFTLIFPEQIQVILAVDYQTAYCDLKSLVGRTLTELTVDLICLDQNYLDYGCKNQLQILCSGGQNTSDESYFILSGVCDRLSDIAPTIIWQVYSLWKRLQPNDYKQWAEFIHSMAVKFEHVGEHFVQDYLQALMSNLLCTRHDQIRYLTYRLIDIAVIQPALDYQNNIDDSSLDNNQSRLKLIDFVHNLKALFPELQQILHSMQQRGIKDHIGTLFEYYFQCLSQCLVSADIYTVLKDVLLQAALNIQDIFQVLGSIMDRSRSIIVQMLIKGCEYDSDLITELSNNPLIMDNFVEFGILIDCDSSKCTKNVNETFPPLTALWLMLFRRDGTFVSQLLKGSSLPWSLRIIMMEESQHHKVAAYSLVNFVRECNHPDLTRFCQSLFFVDQLWQKINVVALYLEQYSVLMSDQVASMVPLQVLHKAVECLSLLGRQQMSESNMRIFRQIIGALRSHLQSILYALERRQDLTGDRGMLDNIILKLGTIINHCLAAPEYEAMNADLSALHQNYLLRIQAVLPEQRDSSPTHTIVIDDDDNFEDDQDIVSGIEQH